MSSVEFKEKFIGFMDILGWKGFVKAAEAGTGTSLKDSLEMQKELGTHDDADIYKKNGLMICPQSTFIHKDLDFQLTQVSDSVILSSEISPVGLINMVHHCSGAIIRLLKRGIMCRGYITRGLIFHDDARVIGSGYEQAYGKEAQVTAFKRGADEKGTPFVEVDSIVCDFVRGCDDPCVKMMFARYVKSDGIVTALFPFQRFEHSFIIAGHGRTFDPDDEKRSVQDMRQMIENFKDRITTFVDRSNPRAVSKSEYYISALDAQLEVCNETDAMIDMLSSPFPPRRK